MKMFRWKRDRRVKYVTPCRADLCAAVCARLCGALSLSLVVLGRCCGWCSGKAWNKCSGHKCLLSEDVWDRLSSRNLLQYPFCQHPWDVPCVGTRDILPLWVSETLLDSASNSLLLTGWRQQSQSVFCLRRRAACHFFSFFPEYGKIMSEMVGS